MTQGYKHYTIVDRLAGELLRFLGNYLSGAQVESRYLAAHLLLLTSKPHYVDRLLFRDFQAPPGTVWCRYRVSTGKGRTAIESIHTQAFTYVMEILYRPLTLAQNLADKPTNMHRLLALLCRYGPDERWRQTVIGRSTTERPNAECPFFRSVADILAVKRSKLGDRFSAISKERRLQYGPLWLTVNQCAAEVPEELSLADVLEIVPKPLAPGLSEDCEVQTRFIRVLDALNERYGSLRACGLNPERWLACAELSINDLKDLERLRKRAKALLRAGAAQDVSQAFNAAFAELGSGRKTVAGFTDFAEFAGSEVGRTLLGYPDWSLDEERDSWAEAIPDAADVEEEAAFEHDLQTLIQDKPGLFSDPIMRYCLREIIGRGRGWYGQVLQDAAFQALVRADPRYARLCDTELVQRLSNALQALLQRALASQKAH